MFPFDYELRVIYTLDANSLKIEYDVKNLSGKTMYFNIGSHEAYYTPEGIEQYDLILDEEDTMTSYILYGNLVSNQTQVLLNEGKVFPLYDKYFIVDALAFKGMKSRAATLKNRRTGRKIRIDYTVKILARLIIIIRMKNFGITEGTAKALGPFKRFLSVKHIIMKLRGSNARLNFRIISFSFFRKEFLPMLTGIMISPTEKLFTVKGRGRSLKKHCSVFINSRLPCACICFFRLYKIVEGSRYFRWIRRIHSRHCFKLRQCFVTHNFT